MSSRFRAKARRNKACFPLLSLGSSPLPLAGEGRVRAIGVKRLTKSALTPTLSRKRERGNSKSSTLRTSGEDERSRPLRPRAADKPPKEPSPQPSPASGRGGTSTFVRTRRPGASRFSALHSERRQSPAFGGMTTPHLRRYVTDRNPRKPDSGSVRPCPQTHQSTIISRLRLPFFSISVQGCGGSPGSGSWGPGTTRLQT